MERRLNGDLNVGSIHVVRERRLDEKKKSARMDQLLKRTKANGGKHRNVPHAELKDWPLRILDIAKRYHFLACANRLRYSSLVTTIS